jgi:exodeoxyribonuclease VII large subunit
MTDPARKKPLPFLPQRIGLITGANSDAEKDVLQNAKLRWPEVQFEVINTHVQGDKSVAEIIFALEQLEAMREIDVIIIARGGGSFQDLLPFSDERLVRKAASLTKPLVSAIGHENDQPLLDLVADLRASTPTDAAKRVVPDVVEERKGIQISLTRIRTRLDSYLLAQEQFLGSIRSRPVLASPYGFIESQQELVSAKAVRLQEILEFRLQRGETEIDQLRLRARSLSPKLTMERGYAVVTDSKGKPVAKAKAGDVLTIKTSVQEIAATVSEVRNNNG